MELRRVGNYTVLFVILLCALASGSTEGKRRAEMVFANEDAHVNERMVKQAWIHSGEKLKDGRDSFEDYDVYIPCEASYNNRIAKLRRIKLHEITSVLPPQMKQRLFDCLTERGVVFGSSVEEAFFMYWFVKCFRLLDGLHVAPGRNLAEKSPRITPPPLASAPAATFTFYDQKPSNDLLHSEASPFQKPSKAASSLAPTPTATLPLYIRKPSKTATSLPPHMAASPFYIPEPSNRAPSLAPAAAEESSFYIPKSSNLAPASLSSQNPWGYKIFQQKLNQESDTDGSPPSQSPIPSGDSPESDSHVIAHYSPVTDQTMGKETLIAIVATALGTFSFVGMIFCCWLCCCRSSNRKVGPRYGQRDDRPLLHLSDFSTSSSQNSVNLENSSSKEHSFNGAPIKGNLSMKNGNHISSLHETPSSECNPGEGFCSLKPPPGKAAPPPPQPPPPPAPSAPRPPTPPKGTRAPPAPPPKTKLRPSPLGPHRLGPSASNEGDDVDSKTGAPKAKLKPFFWDKVMANPDHSMVWHEISDGSFQFNEEMIESLFGYKAEDKNKSDRKKDPSEPSTQYIQIIDTRKAQNLSILLRALNVTTEEVIDALLEGNELPPELLQTLLKMAPTAEEELKLRLYAGELSQLGPAERFLKVLVEIPFAFKRIEALLFMNSVQEDVATLKRSFATLEIACNKLKSSRLFLKILEAVLKTGNRMNDGTFRGGAQAFKLDTLLKLSDVKGTDGKTTLLHFVVQEIIRSEGIRAVRTAKATRSVSSVRSDDMGSDLSDASADDYRNLGLQVVSGLSSELEDVKKAAIIDTDDLTSTVSKLKQSMTKTKAFLDSDMKSLEEETEFYHAVHSFVERAESDISWLSQEESRIMALVKSTVDYFHGSSGKDEGLRLFTIVRDFLVMIDKACKEVRDDRAAKPKRTSKKEFLTTSGSSVSLESRQDSDNYRRRLFPAIAGRRIDNSSSDDESPSP